MGKEKKEKRKSEAGEDGDKEGRWDLLVGRVGPIANPMASRKLTKKLYKVIKKGTKCGPTSHMCSETINSDIPQS